MDSTGARVRVVAILYAALLFMACQPPPAVLLTHLGTTIPREFTRPNGETIALGDSLPSDLQARAGVSTGAGSVVVLLLVPPEVEAMDATLFLDGTGRLLYAAVQYPDGTMPDTLAARWHTRLGAPDTLDSGGGPRCFEWMDHQTVLRLCGRLLKWTDYRGRLL